MAIITRQDWRTIVRRARDGKLLPIISDQVIGQLLYDRRDLIQAWSEDIDYPLSPDLNLSHIAQFLSVQGDPLAAKEEYLSFSRRYLLKRALANRSEDERLANLKSELRRMQLAELSAQLYRPVLDDEIKNPLHRLAQLPIPIYITTSYHNFLEHALRSAGKRPRSEICYWKNKLKAAPASRLRLNPLVRVRDILVEYFSEDELRDLAFELGIEFSDLPGESRSAKAREIAKYFSRRDRLPDLVSYGRRKRPNISWSGILGQTGADASHSASVTSRPSLFDVDPAYEPNIDEPLVYHFLGLDTFPASMVLTEDDYLDFLVSVSADREIVPLRINQALSDSSLILLGYQLQKWDFRVLFRGLITRKRAERRQLSIAIQLAPEAAEEGQADEIKSTQSYLERYFDQANFKIYWGDPQGFVQRLWQQWEAML
jgi:hypothetical protein